jgi:hypothetical protein
MRLPSKPLDAQADCPLFGPNFPSELRNQIYALVYRIETSDEDGSIKLDSATTPPSKALTMTCQRLHNETLAVYRAAYRQFPDHTFTIDMGRTRTLPPIIPRSLSNDILSRINSFRVAWNVDEYNNGAPLRLTTSFDRDAPSQRFKTQLKHHCGDRYWRGQRSASFVHCYYLDFATDSIENFRTACDSRPLKDTLGKVLSHAILRAVYAPREDERIFKI